MVSSVSSSPYYSYLNQLQGTTASSTSAKDASSTSSSSSSSAAQSLVSSLLDNGKGFSSEALSLLQQNSTGSFDPITTLLGGTGTNDALTSLYSNLYDGVTAAALTQAQENSIASKTSSTASTSPTSTTASSNTAQSLIDSQTQASIAYNQTLVQNAQSAAAANAYGPDGVTKLVG